MRKMLQTLILAFFVVVSTGSFCYAEFTSIGRDSFPYFHLGCLMIGGLIIISLKHKYKEIYLSEAVGSFALYMILVALFTSPVVEALKTFVS